MTPCETADDIRSVLAEPGMTQERLARDVGVSLATISRIVRGISKPSPMFCRLWLAWRHGGRIAL